MQRYLRFQAFTIVELMIVVLIIALLALIAIPSFLKVREESRQSACMNNLRIIDNTKQIWAMAVNATQTTPCDMNAIAPYLESSDIPECPNGGVYTVGSLSVKPTCSANGHQNIY